MKLITGYIDTSLQTLTESVDGELLTYIQGVFMQANIENKNRRIYSKDILESAVSKYDVTMVKTGRAVGELNHPEGPGINLDKVSHRITELNWDGDDVIGKALLLEDVPMGKLAKGLLKGGVKFGVSSRGMGTVSSRGSKSYVNNDLILSAVDIVHDPSAPAAFVNGIMEGYDWIVDDGGLITPMQREKYETEIRKASKRNLAEAQIHVWKDFLSKL